MVGAAVPIGILFAYHRNQLCCNNTLLTHCAGKDTFAKHSSFTYPANDPSEDRNLVHSADWKIAAIFDGHGGWQVSDFASKHLVPVVLQNLRGIDEKDEISIDTKLVNSFQAVEDAVIDRVRPSFRIGFGETAKVGSCVLLAMHKGDRLIIANSGDCRAILGSYPSSITHDQQQPVSNQSNSLNSWMRVFSRSSNASSTTQESISGSTPAQRMYSTRISRDHNCRVTLEQLRLYQDHGPESNLYVCKNPHACYVKGRLQLTRSLGDVYLKYPEFNGSAGGHRSG